jgi:hypothetical protein
LAEVWFNEMIKVVPRKPNGVVAIGAVRLEGMR